MNPVFSGLSARARRSGAVFLRPCPLDRRALPVAMLALLTGSALGDEHRHHGTGQLVLPPRVITQVLQETPLTITANPKEARQPIPASDGADYLKTIPGFSAVRGGGSNSDPVLRGMFGSRDRKSTRLN